MENGTILITEERQKQIEKYGFTAEHHVNHPEWYADGQLISAARMLAAYDSNDSLSISYRDIVPKNWDLAWWQRMCDKSLIERLAIAGALIAAELDRLEALPKLKKK